MGSFKETFNRLEKLEAKHQELLTERALLRQELSDTRQALASLRRQHDALVKASSLIERAVMKDIELMQEHLFGRLLWRMSSTG